MFDISFSELAIIGVVALVVIGPERLPKVARTVGHLMGRAQRYVNDVKADIQREIELDEIRKVKQTLDTATAELNASLRETGDSIRNAGQALQADLDTVAAQTKQALDLAPASVPAAATDTGASGAETEIAAAVDTKTPSEAVAHPALAEPTALAEPSALAGTPATDKPAAAAAAPSGNVTSGIPT